MLIRAQGAETLELSVKLKFASFATDYQIQSSPQSVSYTLQLIQRQQTLGIVRYCFILQNKSIKTKLKMVFLLLDVLPFLFGVANHSRSVVLSSLCCCG